MVHGTPTHAYFLTEDCCQADIIIETKHESVWRFYLIFHKKSGLCTEHPFHLTPKEIIEKTWHLTSRVSKVECQTKILQVFCAIQYESNGFCRSEI